MNRKIRTIVVGAAGMQDDDPQNVPRGEDPVVAAAAALAQRLGARLHVVHALERARPGFGTNTLALQSSVVLQERRAEIERRLWTHTRGYANQDRIFCHVVEGSADIQLCGFADEAAADLVVVGATRHGWLQNLLGTTAERVLRRSSIPVLVVRRPFQDPVRRVLLTTDLSELSPGLHETGLDVVEKLFGTEALELRTLLVCAYDVVTAARMSRDFMTRAAAARLHAFLDQRQPRTQPVAAKVRTGNPSSEILQEAAEWQADLLVLGSHGRWGASYRLLGTTGAATLRGASANVLVIPAAQAGAWQETGEQAVSQRSTSGFLGTEEHHEGGILLATGA